MSKNSIVTEQNKTLLVETLRQIAEILIWGDQNDSSVFDFFLERNMLSFFLDIMKQKCGNYVTVQLLQTLNILFENIRHETSLYYLLSNNHVNSIILHKFDLSDEEVMAYYISFLKTLSFKLNPHTIHFFFNTSDFPLYTEAIKYFNHPEKMVRIAVRILTLNVFKVDEKSMLKFITGQTVPCLSDLVHFIRDNVINIEKCLKESSNSSPPTPQPTTPTSPSPLMMTPPDLSTSFNKHLMETSTNSLPQQSQQTNTTISTTTIKNSSTTNVTTNDNNQANAKPTATGITATTTANLNTNSSSISLHNVQNLKINIHNIVNNNNNNNMNNNHIDKILLKIDDLFAEHLDHLHYLNDVLMLKIDDINRILSDTMMHHLIKPLIDAYKDDPRNSMIRLFTLEFTTSILSKVLGTRLDEEDGENSNINVDDEGGRDRSLANDVKDFSDKQDLTDDKLSSAQLAIVKESKKIAEIKVRTLLKTGTLQEMTYLSIFDAEYNDMKRKRLTIDYLLMDAPSYASYSSRQQQQLQQQNKQTLSTTLAPANNQLMKEKSNSNAKLNNTSSKSSNPALLESKAEIDRARYLIRDSLLWRQLLLNIKNEKDRELSLKNTTYLSYAKLLQWLGLDGPA